MANYKNLHPTVKRSFKQIYDCITRFLISKNGKVHMGEIELHTGLQKFTVGFLADMIILMNEEFNVITIKGDHILLNYDVLEDIKEQEKSLLPDNYNAIWKEEDYLVLVDLVWNKKLHPDEIAKNMARTAGAVSMALSKVKHVPMLCRLYTTDKTFKEYADMQVSPNPL